MALKPEISVGMALTVGVLVFAVHQNATPSVADVRTLPEGNEDIERAERSASWISAGIVAGVSLIARDPVIFVAGSTMVIGMAWWTRHANRVNPELKRVIGRGEIGGTTPVQSNPVPEMDEKKYVAMTGSAFAN